MVTRDCIIRFYSSHVASSVTRSRDGYGRRARLVVVSRSIDGVVLVVSTAGEDAEWGERARLERVRGDADGCPFLDAYDVSASDEETPNDRAEGKPSTRPPSRGTTRWERRGREMETTASRDDASRNAEATEARARVEDGTRDDDATMTTTTTTTTTTPVRSIRPVGDRSSREEPPMKASRSTPTRSTRISGDAEMADIVRGWGHRVQSAEFAAETFGERWRGVGREGRRGFRAWGIGRGGAGRRRPRRIARTP